MDITCSLILYYSTFSWVGDTIFIFQKYDVQTHKISIGFYVKIFALKISLLPRLTKATCL